MSATTIVRAPRTATTAAAARPLLVEVPGVRCAIAHAALVVGVVLADLTGAGPAPGLVILLGICVVGTWRLPANWTTFVAVSAWALDTGFVEHAFGRLTFAGPDLGRLAVATAVALAASWVGRRRG